MPFTNVFDRRAIKPYLPDNFIVRDNWVILQIIGVDLPCLAMAWETFACNNSKYDLLLSDKIMAHIVTTLIATNQAKKHQAKRNNILWKIA